jgi:hypothetical protein
VIRVYDEAGNVTETHEHLGDFQRVVSLLLSRLPMHGSKTKSRHAVKRDDIVRGADELGMPLDDVIANVIAALKADAVRLGLAGSEC